MSYISVASDNGLDAEVLEVNIGRVKPFSCIPTSLRCDGGEVYAYSSISRNGYWAIVLPVQFVLTIAVMEV